MTQAVDFINLGFLSEEEQELILEVLRRDEELRQAEEQRVRKLKVALLDMKRRGAKRGSGKYSQKVCGRCLEPLSRLSFFSSKCVMCNHHVCRKCRTLLIGGSWLCSVCARESDVKKMTGDWFYDQRVNRFTIMPGHDLVRVSLRKKPQTKKRETAGELLLRSNEPNLDPPPPAQKKQTSSITRQPNGNPELITSQESFESKPTHSDTESAENVSIISSKNDTESRHSTPEQPRLSQPHLKGRRSLQTSPTPSSVSSKTTPLQAETTSRKSASSDTNNLQDVIPVSQNLDPDVERLFKKSIKRDPRTAGCVSTLDLRDGPELTQTAMGNRSKSVPGLEIQQEDREEDEDIDSLVNFHKNKMASSSSSLLSSKSTLGSMASVYSGAGDFDSVEVSGEVIFSLRYDQHTQGLQVFIEECHGLACGDTSRQTSNPYVKCYLLPEKSRQSKRKTSTKRNTINPVFKETLKYSISRSQLFTRSLSISVWHHGRLSRNAFLGEVEIPLDCRDLDSPYVDRAALLAKSASYQPPSPFARYRGDLVISLKYITPNKTTTERNKGKKGASEVGGELHVLVKEANNLMPTTVGGTTVSFVKGYLFPTRGKSTKRKTPVVKKNVNPHYDHIFAYKSVNLEQLKEMCLEITVWHKEMMSNEFLGGVRLSAGHGSVKVGKEEVDMDSVGEEVSLWQKMMQYPDSWAEGVLPLRSTMTMDK